MEIIKPLNKDYGAILKETTFGDIHKLFFKYQISSRSQEPAMSNLVPDINVDMVYPYDHDGNLNYVYRIPVGKMHLVLINIEACRSYDGWIENVFADSYDRLLFNKVFDYENNDYLQDWGENVCDLRSQNVLYIKSLFLHKNFRNVEIGRIILEELKLRFCGLFAYIITEAIPMQHRKDVPRKFGWDWNTMEKDYDRAEAMYFQFLREIGLRQHQDTDLFFTEGATIL